METFSALLAICARNSSIFSREIDLKRFFDDNLITDLEIDLVTIKNKP